MPKFLRRALRPGKADLRYVDAADFLRVVCTLFVAWYHIWQQSWLNPALSVGPVSVNLRDHVATGYMGVDLLLMLSGFLIYLPYASNREDPIGRFYLKRAVRILPSYWFCILVMLFTFALPQGKYPDAAAMWKDLIAHATFTHNLFPETYFATPLNGAMWTLAVEVQFYLIAPFLCRLFRKQPAATYGGMVLIAMLYRYFFVLPLENTQYMLNRLPNLFEVYANGMLAAHLYVLLVQKGRQKPWQAWLSTLLAFAALWLMWMLLEDQGRVSGYEAIRAGQMQRRFLFSAAGAAFLLFGSRSIRLVRGLYSNRIIRFLSALSLNFYIWHQTLAVRLKEWRIPPYTGNQPQVDGQQPWQLIYTLACFAAALLAALLVTYLIEKPISRMILKKRRAR